MNIAIAIQEYKLLGEYFAPDYEQENKILSRFKSIYPTLSFEQASQLKSILENSQTREDHYFVADLLYLYGRFDEILLEPLLNTAIAFCDPGFNRIFLRPCINAFGSKRVTVLLTDKFNSGDLLQRIDIANLAYWLRPLTGGDADQLHATIVERAKLTNNLVELYHYKLLYKEKIPNSSYVPENAHDLMKKIKANRELEDLLYNKLNWKPDDPL